MLTNCTLKTIVHITLFHSVFTGLLYMVSLQLRITGTFLTREREASSRRVNNDIKITTINVTGGKNTSC